MNQLPVALTNFVTLARKFVNRFSQGVEGKR